MTSVCPKCDKPDWQVGLNERTIMCCHCGAHFHLKEVSGYQLDHLRKRLGLPPLGPRTAGIP